MNVGTIARSHSLDSTQQLPPPSSPDAAPLDMSRDVVDHGPASAPSTSRTTHGATAHGTQAALATPPAARTFVDPQIHRATEAFVRGGLGGLDTFMRQHPADARWLLSVSRDQLAEGIRADLGTRPGYGGFLGPLQSYRDAESIDAHLAGAVQSQIREAVRQTAVDRIDAMTRALESMPIDRAVEALRNAPAGSPLAELRSALRMPGNEMDRERVESWVRTSLHELHALRDTVMGQSWMPEELPGSMRAVQRAMGLEHAAEGSIAGEALFRGPHAADTRAHGHEVAVDGTMLAAETTEMGLEAAEGAHLAAEATHLAHAGLAVESAEMSALATLATETSIAAAGGIGVGLAGLAFGYAIHHQIEHNRAERTETAAALGL
ncbi:MAG: hypothetical protein K1X94_08315 [Sandaracinaceae bacterium]|nr:hypothetical protein [Sandaracinaceae bacterium]